MRRLKKIIPSWHAILLTGVVILNVLLAYYPHIGTSFPLLGDEYVHIALARYILDEATLPFTNPYFPVLFSHINFEFGFHLFLAALFALIPAEPVELYRFLVIPFVAINSLLVFVLARLWFSSFAAALFATFFFGTIKSAGGLLAHEYVLPLTLGTTFLLLAFICLHQWLEGRRRHLLALIVALILLACVYPPALFFFLAVLAAYLVSGDHDLAERFGFTHTSFTVTVLGATALIIAGSAYVLHLGGLFESIFMLSGWDVVRTNFSPVLFFGILPSVLAFLGLFTIAVTPFCPKVPLYWFVVGFFGVYVWYALDAGVLIPFPRLFYFYLIGVSLLAGAGAAVCLHLARQIPSRIGTGIVVTILVLLTFVHYGFAALKQPQHHPILTEANYAVLASLTEYEPRDAVVIADGITSLGIYPASGKRVVGLLDSNIGGGDAAAAHAFLSGNCAEKQRTLHRFTYHIGAIDLDRLPLYVLTQEPTECTFLKPVYHQGPYLYEITDAVYAGLSTAPPLTAPASVVYPTEAVLTEAELRATFGGNTVEGDGWVEYYRKDGYIKGREGEQTYTGIWSTDGPVICFDYFERATNACRTIRVEGVRVHFYDLDGSLRTETNATLRLGNPFDL